MKINTVKIFISIIMTMVIVLSGCGQNTDDFFQHFSLKGNKDYAMSYMYFLNNLPKYRAGVVDSESVFNKTGMETKDGFSNFIKSLNKSGKLNQLIHQYIPYYGISKEVNEMFNEDITKDAEANYYFNKLFYFGDKLIYDASDNKNINTDNNPKAVVEDYLKAIQDSEDTEKYRFASVPDFFNVLDYKYVKTNNEKKYKDYYIISKYMLEEDLDFEFKDVSGLKKQIIDKTGITPEKITIHNKDSDNNGENPNYKIVFNRDLEEYDLIYNVTITNKNGEKLIKKYIFNVSNDNPYNILKVRYYLDMSDL